MDKGKFGRFLKTVSIKFLVSMERFLKTHFKEKEVMVTTYVRTVFSGSFLKKYTSAKDATRPVSSNHADTPSSTADSMFVLLFECELHEAKRLKLN